MKDNIWKDPKVELPKEKISQNNVLIRVDIYPRKIETAVWIDDYDGESCFLHKGQTSEFDEAFYTSDNSVLMWCYEEDLVKQINK